MIAKLALLLVLMQQGVQDVPGYGSYAWEWESPYSVSVWKRDTYVLTDAESAHGCFVSATWFDRHMVEIRCPAFSPFGVDIQRFCVVHSGETLVRAKLVNEWRPVGRPVERLNVTQRQLVDCDVKASTK